MLRYIFAVNTLPGFGVRLALLGLLVAPIALSGAAVVAPGADAPLDEVLVEVNRGKLIQEMIKLEDRFFERYNELNTNDDFDTECDLETRAGTRVERRYCRAVYQTRALQKEASGYLYFLQKNNGPPSNNPAPQGVLTPPPSPLLEGPPLPSYMEIVARRKDYQENVRKVVSQHPELQDLLRERYELGLRYEKVRNKGPGIKRPAGKDPASTAPLLP